LFSRVSFTGSLVYAKRGDPQPLLLWGVCGEKEEAEQNSSSGDEEWMYQLDRRARICSKGTPTSFEG